MRTLRLLLILCILPFLSVEAQNSNYYVTPTGAGDGSAWTKSLNAKSFVSKFSDEAYQKDTFHLSEGKYLLNAKEPQPLMTNVKGGYVADDYTVRDPFNNESVISGSVSTKENECVTVQVTAPTEAEITLDGVVLESAAAEPVIVSSAGEGSAVILKGCVLRKAAPNVCEDQVVKIDTTIYLGMAIKELPDAKFEKIGRFIEEVTSEGENGCNLITQYVVSVLPKSDGKLNYYVKQNGTGDGSSWENAMGDTAFAYAFGRVEEGATFHVAEGVYHPIYDGTHIDMAGVCSSKSFYSSVLVNLIGGYDADVTDKDALPDTANHTRVVGDLTEVSGTMVYPKYLLYMGLPYSTEGNFRIEGIEFEKNANYPGQTSAMFITSGEKVHFTLERCKFNHTYGGVISECSGTLKDCQFEVETWPALIWSSVLKTSININSCYVNMPVRTGGYACKIENSTIFNIVDEEGNEDESIEKTVDISYSTIGSLSVKASRSYNFVGNIFWGSFDEVKQIKGLTSHGNLYPKNSYDDIVAFADAETDKFLESSEMEVLLEYDGKEFVVAENGGYTKTIQLLSDTLPDGTSIRIPRGTILTDQIGKDRALNTCPGAYELAGYTKEIYSDEVLVYTVSDTYPQIGETELIKEEKQEDGNTLIIHYKVIVLPNAAPSTGETLAYNYYVKQNGSGTGDGSSWANAMSDTSFAFAFGKVPSGATFHMAAGEYHPMYVESVTEEMDECTSKPFQTNHLVNLIGGYAANVTDMNALPDTANHTKLVGEIACNDEIKVYPKNVLYISPSNTLTGECRIEGIEFEKNESGYSMNAAVFIEAADGVRYTFEKCKFNNTHGGVRSLDGNVTFNNCQFETQIWPSLQLEGDLENVVVINSCYTNMGVNLGSVSCQIVNSTIDNIFDGGEPGKVLDISHSTIGLFNMSAGSTYHLVGNILLGSLTGPEELESLSSHGNLYPKGVYDYISDYVDAQTDRFLEKSEMVTLLEHDGDEFVAAENGGYTKSIKLMRDTTSDGTPIRFIHSAWTETKVDQRGVTRPDSTCPGAYEFGFTQRIIELPDTAMVLDICEFSYALNQSKTSLKSWSKSADGTTYDFSFDLHDAKIPVAGGATRFVKPGDLYVWRDTIRHDESDVMYDTIFVRKISVLPKPSPNFKESNELHYYVKVDGSGNGDGSSWENAMSNSAFAFAIENVSSGSTFHFASGKYKPINSTLQIQGTPYPSYWTDRAVNLIGGYVANPQEGAVENPGTDSTIAVFSGDSISRGIVVYDLKSNGAIKVSGITFTDGTCYNGEPESYSLHINAAEGAIVNADIERCVFTTNRVGLYLQNVMANVNESLFECIDATGPIKTYHYAMGISKYSKVNINSSLFTANPYLLSMDSTCVIGITNSSFVNNVQGGSDAALSLSGEVTLLNNTFFNNVEIIKATKVISYGNVLEKPIKFNHVGDIVFKGNIFRNFNPYDYKSLDMPNGENISFSDADFQAHFQYDGDAPLLADNGGFTKTVAMISDMIGNRELRVSQTLTGVSVDQRGEKRFSMACIGAYEMSEYIHREPLADTTIVVGNPVTVGGASYDKIGEYVWKDTIVNPDGSQTAYSRNVVVMPKAGENLYYYVKQNGTGDGSSWTNAMSDSAFAFAFSRVEDGATFHIAEGTYHPIYNHSGDISENETDHIYIERDFYTTHLVNLVGGYPSQPDENSLPDTKYHTVLSGADATASGIIRSRNVIYMEPEKAGTIKLSGIRFAGSSKFQFDDTNASLYVDPKVKGVHVDLDKCRFEAIGNLMKMDSCSTTITECNFVSENRVIIDGDASDSLIISNSSFDCPLEVKANGYMIVNSTIDSLYIGGKKETSLSNGELIHNTILSLHYNTQWTSTLTNNIVCHISQTEEGVLKGDHNLIRNDEELNISNVGLFVTMNDLLDLLNNDQGQFIMSYADGSFTRTIALLKDSVAGQSIRSARLADVKNDQNGRARYDETCAGAFELPGMVITTQGEDTTIIVHESIDGIAFDQIGVHQHCTTTVKEDESKVVTCRTVTVLPKDDASLHYYVSQHGLGLKDGSSQANAMSDSSFAFSFGKVPSRSTFIIVEGGTYYPYNMDDTLAGGLSPKGFYSDRCVSVKALDGLDDNSLPILSGCLGTEKLDTLVYVKNQASADITEFNRIQFSNSSTANGTINDSKMIFEGSVFQLMSCRFKNFTDSLTIQAIRSRGVLEACDFDMNGKFVTFEGPIMEPTPSIAIKRSSFDCIVYANCFNCSVENSSFYSLETKMIGSKVRLTHNTLRKLIITAGNLEVSANLIEDITEKPEFKECNDVMASHENLFGTVGFLTIDIDPSDTVSTGLFGQLTKFDAMAYQGNFTKSYMMIRDTLSDGSSIRVNRESSMSKDQYGKNRYPMTCRGAIELDGYTQHRTLYDTILVHDTYYLDNVRYDEVGYKVINAKALNSYGGEDPITAYLTVLPKNGTGKISAPYHYYVKQNGSGNKDGSSWQNAMSDTTFAEIFGRVRNNSTFHVAAGVYHPVYDQSLALASASDTAIATFYTDRWVNIVGGYDANVTDISAVPNPKGERTIFTRAVAGEDVSAESDSIAVITYAPSVARTFSISGVTISGGTSLQIKAQKSGVMFQVENTLMKYGVGVKADKLDSLYLNAVTFDSCQTGVAAGELSYLKAVNSTFAADPNALDGELAISLPSIFNGRCVLTHNTLLAPVSVSGGSYYWTGNIFAGGVVACDGSKQGKVDSKYNLYPENASVAQSYDIQNSLTAMEELFGGTWNLDYTLGFTPVLPLASDVLNNGRSIRFKREVSNLSVDQIGESRLFLTCMGAYEYANVTELTIPTAFTPYTKDGINDIFMFGYPVFIYDRYGRLIANSDNGWDGKYRGEDADAGVYVYVLWDANGKQYKGTVEILKQK